MDLEERKKLYGWFADQLDAMENKELLGGLLEREVDGRQCFCAVGAVAPIGNYTEDSIEERVRNEEEPELLEWMRSRGVSLRALKVIESLNDQDATLATGGVPLNDEVSMRARHARVVQGLRALAGESMGESEVLGEFNDDE
jgi:hypothetical protein